MVRFLFLQINNYIYSEKADYCGSLLGLIPLLMTLVMVFAPAPSVISASIALSSPQSALSHSRSSLLSKRRLLRLVVSALHNLEPVIVHLLDNLYFLLRVSLVVLSWPTVASSVVVTVLLSVIPSASSVIAASISAS